MRSVLIALAAGLTMGGAAGWMTQGWRTDAAMAKLRQAGAQQAQARAEQSQAATTTRAGALLTHADAQQDNTHAYTDKIHALETGRAADAARIAGLQHDIRAAATRAAQASGDAAACRSLADQHERLAASVAEGAGVVGELVGLVERRDTQIGVLQGQVKIDRALIDRLQ